MQTLRQVRTLMVLVLRYWARAGLPNRLRNDQGRRASGAVLRVTFLLLMVNWGYRIGTACMRVDPDVRAAAVAWLLVGLVGISITWGAMGRGPSMRGPQSALTSPLLDALPLAEASRVVISLFERVMLYALGGAAIVAIAPGLRADLVLLAFALPTAGLVVGDSLLRLARTVVSPMRMARVAMIALVMQFPCFMLIGGAPILAKLPRASVVVQHVLPAATAILEGGSVFRLLVALALLGLLGAVGIGKAERIGYDRIDIVPTRKLGAVASSELDLVRIERVLAKREPGGRWLARSAFFYTFATSAGLLALSLLSKGKATRDGALLFVRSVGFVAIFSGFAVVQARATRMVVRDAGARAMLAPLPIAPSDLLRGKTRALVFQVLLVAAPYFLLLGLPGSTSMRLEVLWRGSAAVVALMLAASATVAVAFLTQGLGGVKTLGGNIGIETTLVAMPLLAVAAAPYPWSAVVSLACLAMLAFEARRSALRCVRWIDDADDFERETPVWRALLVFASFQAAQTLGRRALSLAPIDENMQAAIAYTVAALVLLALTLHGRRGLPRMRALPERRAPLWVLGALALGIASGAFAVGFRYVLRRSGVDVPVTADDDVRVVTACVTVVLAPIVEEIFFRGWLQNTIEGELPAQRRWAAPLFAAFAFAAVRPPLAFVPVLVLGVVTGMLYARSRSVGPGVAAHAVHVAISLAARYLLAV
jgi:membrane protease YdiL (CAAX protease family)